MTARRDRDARALYVISVAAELAGVHAQTLRIYERKGLIEPARTSGGNRRYSDRDIALLRRIQELTGEGVSLAGVQRILELEERLDRALRRIEALEAELARVRREAVEAVDEARRGARRDLVPVRSQTIVRYGRSASFGQPGSGLREQT